MAEPTATDITADDLKAAVNAAYLRLAGAKRVEFGDQAVTHTSADELLAISQAIRAGAAGTSSKPRSLYSHARFRCR